MAPDPWQPGVIDVLIACRSTRCWLGRPTLAPATRARLGPLRDGRNTANARRAGI